jgi:hypothetical protein
LVDLLLATTDDQTIDDRVKILMWLEKIDPKFLNFKPVENLTIDFTQGYAGSINAHQSTINSLSAPSNQECLSEQVRVSTFFS